MKAGHSSRIRSIVDSAILLTTVASTAILSPKAFAGSRLWSRSSYPPMCLGHTLFLALIPGLFTFPGFNGLLADQGLWPCMRMCSKVCPPDFAFLAHRIIFGKQHVDFSKLETTKTISKTNINVTPITVADHDDHPKVMPVVKGWILLELLLTQGLSSLCHPSSSNSSLKARVRSVGS